MELIIGMAIFAIFMVCIITVLGPILNTYAQAKEFADESVLASNLSDEITNELAYALKLTDVGADFVSFETYGSDPVKLEVVNGYLVKNGINVYDPKYYKGCTIALVFDYDTGSEVFDIHLTVTGKTQFAKDFTVKPIMRFA